MSRAKNDRNIIRFGPPSSEVDDEILRLRREQQQAEFRLTQGGLLLPDVTAPGVVAPPPPVSVPGDLNTALEAGFPYLLNDLGDVFASYYSSENPYRIVDDTVGLAGSSGVVLHGNSSLKTVEFPSGTVTSIPLAGYQSTGDATSFGNPVTYRGHPFFTGGKLIVPVVFSDILSGQRRDFAVYDLSSGEYSHVETQSRYNNVRAGFPYEDNVYMVFSTSFGGPGASTFIKEYDLTPSVTDTGPSLAFGDVNVGLRYGSNIAWTSTGSSRSFFRINMSNPIGDTVSIPLSPSERPSIAQVNKGFVDSQDRLVYASFNPSSALWEISRINLSGTRSTLPLVFSGNPLDQPVFINPSSDQYPVFSSTSPFLQPGVAAGPGNGYFIYGAIAQDFGLVNFDGSPLLTAVPAIWFTDGTSTQRIWTLPDSDEFPLELLAGGVYFAGSTDSHIPQASGPNAETIRRRRFDCAVSHLSYDFNTRRVSFLVRRGASFINSNNFEVHLGSQSLLYRVQL